MSELKLIRRIDRVMQHHRQEQPVKPVSRNRQGTSMACALLHHRHCPPQHQLNMSKIRLSRGSNRDAGACDIPKPHKATSWLSDAARTSSGIVSLNGGTNCYQPEGEHSPDRQHKGHLDGLRRRSRTKPRYEQWTTCENEAPGTTRKHGRDK